MQDAEANRSRSLKFTKANRRHFIGGSDARIIMGTDEAALVRLWQEKRGEIEPIDLSGKHAIYSNLTLLPGESQVDFDELHGRLILEFMPNGVSELTIVNELARLIWRKRNFRVYQIANHAKQKSAAIREALLPPPEKVLAVTFDGEKSKLTPEEGAVLNKAIAEREDKELGWTTQLVELGDVVTPQYLMMELSLQERLDKMIDGCVKRLLFIRGFKSVAAETPESQRRKWI